MLLLLSWKEGAIVRALSGHYEEGTPDEQPWTSEASEHGLGSWASRPINSI